MNETINLQATTIEKDYTKQERMRLRFAVSVFYFCQGLCFSSWASRIPDIKSALHLSEADLGTVLLGLPAGQLMMMSFSGRLVTKYGSRNMLSLGAFLYALELINLGWASSKWQLAAALFIFGLCGNLCNISVNTQAIGVEKIYKRSVMTSFHGAWSTAGFTGAMIGLMMMAFHLAPLTHFMIVTALVIIATITARKYTLPGKDTGAPVKKFFARPDPQLIQLGVIGFCSMATEGAMFDWSGVYFKQVVKVPPALVTLGYASFMIMMATGRFTGDFIITKHGRKRTLQISGIAIATGLLTAVFFPYIVTATIGFLIVGFGVSSVVPTVYSTAGRLSNTSPGMALASVASISFLGFLMGPPLIGYVAQAAGLQYSFAIIALIGFSITLMVSRLKVIH
jgi:MFS family permease